MEVDADTAEQAREVSDEEDDGWIDVSREVEREDVDVTPMDGGA
jgi:hypothetical protein